MLASVHINMGEFWDTYLLEKGRGQTFLMGPTAEVMNPGSGDFEQVIWNPTHTYTHKHQPIHHIHTSSWYSILGRALVTEDLFFFSSFLPHVLL